MRHAESNRSRIMDIFLDIFGKYMESELEFKADVHDETVVMRNLDSVDHIIAVSHPPDAGIG